MNTCTCMNINRGLCGCVIDTCQNLNIKSGLCGCSKNYENFTNTIFANSGNSIIRNIKHYMNYGLSYIENNIYNISYNNDILEMFPNLFLIIAHQLI